MVWTETFNSLVSSFHFQVIKIVYWSTDQLFQSLQNRDFFPLSEHPYSFLALPKSTEALGTGVSNTLNPELQNANVANMPYAQHHIKSEQNTCIHHMVYCMVFCSASIQGLAIVIKKIEIYDFSVHIIHQLSYSEHDLG